MEKEKHPVQWGRLTKAIDDSLIDTIGQVEVTGSKPFSVTIVFPYGISANAPAESTVMTSNMTRSGKSKSGIASNPENRFRDLKEGEVKVGNFLSKAHTYFTEDGEVQINPTHEESTDWAVQFSALKDAFDELQGKYNAHVHGGSTAGGSPCTILPPQTSAPPEPSTGDIDAAKVDNVRMP